MKKSLIALSLSAILAAPSVQAMRINDGKTLIKEGDSIGELTQHMGRGSTSVVKVCRLPSSSSCRGGTAWGIRHVYIAKDRTWIVDELHGIITHIEWTR